MLLTLDSPKSFRKGSTGGADGGSREEVKGAGRERGRQGRGGRWGAGGAEGAGRGEAGGQGKQSGNSLEASPLFSVVPPVHD